MLSNKTWGIAGAAMLGTAALLGTNAANAVIDLDAGTSTANFAKESITATVTGKDGNTYYKLDGGGDVLNVKAEVGFGAVANSSLIIKYTFDGMVLTSASKPRVSIGADLSCGTSVHADDSAAGTAVKREGGAAGENTVTFLQDVGNANLADTHDICLTLEDAGVSMGGGSITMQVNDTLSIPATNTASYSGAVVIKPAIGEAVQASASTVSTKDLTASVSEGYLLFTGVNAVTTGEAAGQSGNVGQFVGTVDTTLLDAADGTALGGGDEIRAPGTNEANTATGNISTVQITGDFSFASSVVLSATAACDNTNDLRMAAVDGVRDTTKLKTQSLAYVSGKVLCFKVRPKTDSKAVKIPNTDTYKVMVTYGGGSITGNSKFPPQGVEQALGRIVRDGITVRLPYLTTNARYRQRIRMANRGSSDVAYDLEFHGTNDMPLSMATGTLPMKSTTVVLVSDAVTPGNGSNTSATLSIEAQKGTVDVVTVQTNSALGTTDTLVYTTTN